MLFFCSAERPCYDPCSHQARRFWEGAWRDLWCLPEHQEEMEDRCECFNAPFIKPVVKEKLQLKKKKSNSVQMPYRASIYTLLIFLIYQNVMILGDFNADGSYVSKKDMKEIRIRSDKNFHWLISDDVDTTVNKGNDNTYDRWVTQILLDVYYYCYTNIAPISCHPSLWYPF